MNQIYIPKVIVKAKGYLDYNAVKTGAKSKYIGFKFFYKKSTENYFVLNL